MKNKKTEERYYTYSGVPTKDTLSIKEQRELDEKKKNNTLTKEDREKLRWIHVFRPGTKSGDSES